MTQFPSWDSAGEFADGEGVMDVDTACDHDEASAEAASSAGSCSSVLQHSRTTCKKIRRLPVVSQPLDKQPLSRFTAEERRCASQEDRDCAQAVLFSLERCIVLRDLLSRIIQQCAGKEEVVCGRVLLEFVEAAIKKHDLVAKKTSVARRRELEKAVKSSAPDGSHPDAEKHELATAKLQKFCDVLESESTFQRRLGRIREKCSDGDEAACRRYVNKLEFVLRKVVEALIQQNDAVIAALRRVPRDGAALAKALEKAIALDKEIFGTEEELHKKKSPWRVILGVLANAEAGKT